MDQNEHGDLRASAGIGWDTGAALALGVALDISASAIEALMARKLNEQMASGYRSRLKP